MIAVNVHEAKTNFSRLLSQLEKSGEPVLICRNGKPVADYSPPPGQAKHKAASAVEQNQNQL